MEIRTIPTFYLFAQDKHELFSGPPLAGRFVQFISNNIGEGLEEADKSWIDRDDDHIILFTRSPTLFPFFAGAYAMFKDRGVAFGIARDSETFQAFGEPGLPSIWFFKDGAKTMYSGKREFAALSAKISEFFGVDLDESDL
jgi:hypothetical protein